ncbi:hypothetical protein PM082_008054 [Marasmius tenuissimus]|nr:hypothetical protein PM082_008054 [Marasmius tenuissimus]
MTMNAHRDRFYLPQTVSPQSSLSGSLASLSSGGSSPVLVEGPTKIPSSNMHLEDTKESPTVHDSFVSNSLELYAPRQTSPAALAAPDHPFPRSQDQERSLSPVSDTQGRSAPASVSSVHIPCFPQPPSRGRSRERSRTASMASLSVVSRPPSELHRSYSRSRSYSPVRQIVRERTRSRSTSRAPYTTPSPMRHPRRSRSRSFSRSPSLNYECHRVGPAPRPFPSVHYIPAPSLPPQFYARSPCRSRSPPFAIEKHSKYRFIDANVSVVVEDRMRFDVHKHFLERDSFFLQGMLSARPNGPNGSYRLTGITIQEFESLLDFFYDGMYRISPTDAPIQSWVDLLAASTKLHFAKARDHAIAAIDDCQSFGGDYRISPARMIYLATTYEVRRWLEPAYAALIERDDLMSDEEAEMVGAKRVLMIAKAREAKLQQRLRRHTDYAGWAVPLNRQRDPSVLPAFYDPHTAPSSFPTFSAPIGSVPAPRPLTPSSYVSGVTGTTVSPMPRARPGPQWVASSSHIVPTHLSPLNRREPSLVESPYPFQTPSSPPTSLTPSSRASPLPHGMQRPISIDYPDMTHHYPPPPPVDQPMVPPPPGSTTAPSTPSSEYIGSMGTPTSTVSALPHTPVTSTTFASGPLPFTDTRPDPPPSTGPFSVTLPPLPPSVSPESPTVSYQSFNSVWGFPPLRPEGGGHRGSYSSSAPKSVTETVVDTIFDL